MSGARLLGLVQRMLLTGMAMARGINRIARQRLEGQDLARMAPAGFNTTLTNGLIVQAVAWTAALRERLLALAGRPSFVARSSGSRSPRGQGAPRGRGAGSFLPETVPEAVAGDWHDWRELAKSWRMGPSGVAVATRMIAELSNAEVVTRICAKLSQAAAQLGAEADVGRIAEMEAAARALCPEAAAADEDSGGEAKGAPDVWEAGPPPQGAEAAADGDPPPKPPD
jgi:hypothetical protein